MPRRLRMHSRFIRGNCLNTKNGRKMDVVVNFVPEGAMKKIGISNAVFPTSI